MPIRTCYVESIDLSWSEPQESYMLTDPYQYKLAFHQRRYRFEPHMYYLILVYAADSLYAA